MAYIYQRVNGRKFEKAIAMLPSVQASLQKHTEKAAERARALLIEHRHQGHAEIEIERGRVDRYLILSDMRGLKAAMSIEYGRQPNDEGKGGMAGLYILHRAMELPRRSR